MCIECVSRPARLFVCLRFMCMSLGEGCVEALCLLGGWGVFVRGWGVLESCYWGGLVSGREDAAVGRVHEGQRYIWRI